MSASSLGPDVRGWVQHGILWHLMEHGTAAKAHLAGWLGTGLCHTGRAVGVLEGRGLLQVVPSPTGSSRRVYGLTPAGIELALQITVEHWQGPGRAVQNDTPNVSSPSNLSQPQGASHGQSV